MTPGIPGSAGQPRVARQRGGPCGRAVVGAIARDHLLPPGIPARELDRALVRLRTPLVKNVRVRSPGVTSVSRASFLRASFANFGLIVHSRSALLLDRGHETGVLVPDVQADRLGAEVEVVLAVVVPETTAPAAGHGDRVELRLNRPGVENMGAVGRADLLPVSTRANGW